ncbi:hypothetical protein [Bacillus sp. KH172YL63]|uniref:hypothetical protein n=1 Tax=Bacillus sp. KH172YL63 TaxID=2709784 RepID=UPI0013E44F4D|nr:hypothetical protein [Bacillus sp. KH172YL63]BCB03992.1 hypothetical protein KH172YL63_21250 [Bacillus sp. KH172YL63]
METIPQQKSGRKILLTVTWILTFMPYLFSPILLGPIAFCLGIVLRRDYEAGNQGKIIMVLSVVNTIVGILLPIFVIQQLAG